MAKGIVRTFSQIFFGWRFGTISRSRLIPGNKIFFIVWDAVHTSIKCIEASALGAAPAMSFSDVPIFQPDFRSLSLICPNLRPICDLSGNLSFLWIRFFDTLSVLACLYMKMEETSRF
jgi:hypothetical protein